MRKAKAVQVQRIANLEKVISQMYLKIEAFKTRIDNLETNLKNENKITG